MTQEELAQALGLPREKLNSLERGEFRIVPGIVVDLCGTLDVQPSSFFV